jgi:hypothetical protein
MAQSCRYQPCTKEVSDSPQLSRNKIHRDYCSLYCREATLNNTQPINRIGQGGWDKSVITYKPIKKKCSVCRTDFELKYHDNRNNQRFCSKDCYQQLLKRHNGHRDFMILSILHEKGVLASREIAKISSSFQKTSTLNGISLILKAWKGRGIVSAYKESEHGAYTYTYVSKLFPGEAIIKFCRKLNR